MMMAWSGGGEMCGEIKENGEPVSSGQAPNESASCNLPSSLVPHRHGPAKIGIIGQVTADRRVVAKSFVLDNRLSTPNRVEEIGLVIRNGVVTRWCGERFHFFVHAEIERCG